MTAWRRLAPRWVGLPSILVGAACFVPTTARAATPTTAECLAASDASIEAANVHRLRQERTHLLLCSVSTCPAEIRAECVRRVEEVNAAIPTIIFEARDAAGADWYATTVAMDGEVLAERLDGMALAVDPGEHTFTFETLGQPPVRKTFVIREGQKERREAITIDWAVAPPKAGAGSGRRTQKILAIATAGVGVVAFGFGAAFGLDAIAKRNAARQACLNECANPVGAGLWKDAKSSGDLATAGFVVGAVAIAGAATLWWTAGLQPTKAPPLRIGVGLGSLGIGGEW